MSARGTTRRAPAPAAPPGEARNVTAPRAAGAAKPAKPPRKRRPPFVL
jgi:hypothetical protein